MPGPSNTLLIEGSFAELADELAQYLDTVSKSEADSGVQSEIATTLSEIRENEQAEEPADAAVMQKQKDEVLKKIVGKAVVLSTAPEKGELLPVPRMNGGLIGSAEFTAAYNLLIHLSNQSPSRDMFLARICSYLSEQPVTSSTQFGPSLALTTLTTIFNILPNDSQSRYHVFLAILKVIRSTSNNAAFDALTPQLDTNVPKWVVAWELDDEDARSLHVAIADVAAASGNNDMCYKYLLHGLETIPPQSASEQESRDLAKRTLIAALTNSSITDFNPLIDREAIQALRDSDASLFDLLNIFASDDYSAYTDFLESNSLSSMSLPESAVEPLKTKIRLLTLASLAASAANRSIPYSTISDELQIPEDDVEMWVIDTIRAGLVEGKLSQLKREFLIQRATYRVFGPKQWSEIQGRLMVWQQSIEGVLSLVKSEREKFEKEGAGVDEGPSGGERRFGGYRGQGGKGRNQPNHQPREVDFVGAD